ncbi:hypothetical protein [Acidithiobacillus ferrianus]|uniref:hypothetical protein n=1 Tax=Acidithiobacillus ferrianus TaxID=2678518 RepID=UPI0034E4FA38
MNAQDIEFVMAEVKSVKINGYAKHSKLPRKTANAAIVQRMAEDVDTNKARSNYVHILMEIGIPRRSAYRLVDEAYRVRMAKDTASSAPATDRIAIHPVGDTKCERQDIDATKVTAAQNTVADAMREQPVAATIPSITPAPRHIDWPDEVRNATNSATRNTLEDLVRGAWRLGVYTKETQIGKDDYAPPLRRIEANMAKSAGVFANAIMRKAFWSGTRGEEPPMGKLAKIPEGTSMDGTDLEGKKASVFIPADKTKTPTPDLEYGHLILTDYGHAPYQHKQGESQSYFVKTRDSADNERTTWGVNLQRAIKESGASKTDIITISNADKENVAISVKWKHPINALMREGDECMIFEKDGKRMLDKKGMPVSFKSLADAAEFAGLSGDALAVVIHQA